MIAESRLARLLRAGHFVLTGELGPPRGANVEKVREKARHLAGSVDAANITDNQTAMTRMASWAASVIALSEGVEPVYQMTCRDRNRLAMQADILGAWSLGIRNLLCLSGDHQCFGDHPNAKGVFDVDSTQLIGMVKAMRDDGVFLSGAPIDVPPRMFIGAAANPFAEPHEWRVHRLAKKVAAGADFIQTQSIYNMPRFREWLRQAVDMGLTERVYILAGITPMKSLAMARYMKEKVPGMDVPDDLVRRLEGAGKGNYAKEGIRIACEQIAELRETRGVAGIHLMAIEWEHKTAEIAGLAGLLPRLELPELAETDSSRNE